MNKNYYLIIESHSWQDSYDQTPSFGILKFNSNLIKKFGLIEWGMKNFNKDFSVSSMTASLPESWASVRMSDKEFQVKTPLCGSWDVSIDKTTGVSSVSFKGEDSSHTIPIETWRLSLMFDQGIRVGAYFNEENQDALDLVLLKFNKLNLRYPDRFDDEMLDFCSGEGVKDLRSRMPGRIFPKTHLKETDANEMNPFSLNYFEP